MNYFIKIFFLITCFSLMGCGGSKVQSTFMETDPGSHLIKYDKVETLLKQMTRMEKIGQMNQYNGFWDFTGPTPSDGAAKEKYEHLQKGLVGSMLNVTGVENVRKIQKIAVEETRLGIPIIFGFDVIHGYRVQSPIPLAEAASWDLEAIKNSARMAASAASATGLNWTFAPMVDIGRDPRWGRVMEGAGEDPFLGCKIAEARVTGFQGENLAANNTIAACAKHLAAYGFAEAGRDYNTADLGTSTLFNVVLPPFKAAVDAGAVTLMNSFNELNGIPATADKWLQRDILKGSWGFDGFVVSDWGSITEMQAHGYAKNLSHASELAVSAGSDMDMESYGYIKHLDSLVTKGTIDEKVLDESVRRILNVKFELGLFDDPYKYCNKEREENEIDSKAQHDAALDLAKKSVVLLKNEGNLLPLKSNQKIAVIGPMVDEKTSPLGNWRLGAKNGTAVSLKEGLSKYTDFDWTFHHGIKFTEGDPNFVFELKVNETDKTGMDEAVEMAKDADVVVLALGEHGLHSGEARSKTDISIPTLQKELLNKIYEVNKNIVLLNFSGRPLILTWADEHVPTILQAWHLGSQSGNALAEVLIGDYNPSGKLPMTFPRSLGQIPIYYNSKNTGRPSQHSNKDLVFWSHYIDESNAPLYAFGHGLSYTSFKYHDLKAEVNSEGKINLTISITNTGEIAGTEMAQLYIQDKIASVTRPVKELKGFQKVVLNAGESKTITFILGDKELGFYNNQGKFVVESGDFAFMVGGSSDKVMSIDIHR